jgi:hypothetical protein
LGIETPLLLLGSAFQDRRAAASGSVTVQRLAIDKGTFEWYKDRISGGIKLLILLVLLSADDSPPLGTTSRSRLFAGVHRRSLLKMKSTT